MGPPHRVGRRPGPGRAAGGDGGRPGRDWPAGFCRGGGRGRGEGVGRDGVPAPRRGRDVDGG